jgi:CheY-like chemotaxis protein
VEDTGDGIEPSILERIFDPFFTTKPFGQATGLGLSTVYGIVKQSRGDVRVQSRPGRGTTFTVLLPAVAVPAAVENAPEDSHEIRAAAPSGRRTVLLVEDDAAVRRLAARVLRNAGWTVLVAKDPAGALTTAATESQTIDLLITDVVLPSINGGELAERLRALRPGLPVLFMSGYAPEELVASGALPAGGQLLRKPFVPAALRERAEQILKRDLLR